MSQYITFPTHKDGNTLDLVFTNNENLIHECSPIPILPSTSHHNIVMVSTTLKVNNLAYDDDQPEPRSNFNTLNFFSEEIDWNKLKNELSQINWKEELCSNDPQEILSSFNQMCYETCKKQIPVRTTKTSKEKKSKVERYRCSLSKRRRKLTKRLIKSTSQTKKAKITRELLQIEMKLQKSFKESKYHMENKAIDSIKRNSKYFFSYARKKSKMKSKIGPLLNAKGELTQRHKEMAEILSDQYLKVFSNPRAEILDTLNENDNGVMVKDISDLDITESELIKAINELSQTAAPGPDGFPAIFLKQCKEELAIPLCILWRKSIENGIVPEDLKSCTITPIHKGGSRSIAANYRPVALTSHVIKIFEKILRSHIVKHMDENNLFNPNQHGFRSGRSCLSQLLEQYDLILNILDEDANADVVYLDFSKAFDKVDHTIVLNKIKKLGITGKIFQWLKSFLTGRKQSVMVNGVKSKSQNVISGVPQGSVLGPLIFLILIGDIDKEVKHSFVKSFADDTRATKLVRTNEDIALLQEDLQQIYKWTDDNNMKLNDVKFELLRYGPNQLIKDQTKYTSPSGENIESKGVVKDLGVLMSNDCSFKDQITAIIEKAKNLISWILRTFSSRSFKCMITLYKSLVVPIIEYCSVLWSPNTVCLIQRLEEIQKSFLRKINGTSNNYWECLKQTKMYSLQRRRERYRIIYVWKVIEKIVPNVNNSINTKENPRLGRMCSSSFSKKTTSKYRVSTLAVQGVKLFNAMPKSIRNLKNISIEKFKNALDSYLKSIPDEPQIHGYTGCRRAISNSIIHMKNVC